MATNGVDFSRLANVPQWKHPFYVVSFTAKDISPSLRRLLKARIQSYLLLGGKDPLTTINGKEKDSVRPGESTAETSKHEDDNVAPSSKVNEENAYNTLSENIELETQMATLAKIEKRIKEIEVQIELLDGEKHSLFSELKKTQDIDRTKETNLAETKRSLNTRTIHNSPPNSNAETTVDSTVDESRNLTKNHQNSVQTSRGSSSLPGANYQPSPYSKTELKTFIDRSNHSIENFRTSSPFPRKRSYSSFHSDSSDFRSGYSHGPPSGGKAKNSISPNHSRSRQHTQRFANDRIPSSDSRDSNDHKLSGIKKEIH
ncbi:uncharacterized protein LOC126318427 [Schistocerca gregaria]|uniref:uncharacterized protein LOC126318427 n=1 Tax=Schistocerca gregaria TaxID=7010 RepID=UPI00211EBF2D|nr:uncharacterized protein LOC126318427 [Schistocerca gregaria]